MSAILITSAGRRVGLSNAFRQASQSLGLAQRIVAVDLNPSMSAACAMADAAYTVPRVTDPAYIPTLLDTCKREDVRLLIPTIDTELVPLADAASQFEAAGVRINVGGPDFVRIARDKLLTAQHLEAIGIDTPLTRTTLDNGAIRAPLIIKPRGGSSSVGIRIFHDPAELEGFTLPDGFIAQELLEGPEYTVNTFYDDAGVFRAAIPHQRLETRGGEMSKGRTEDVPALTDMARKIGVGLPGVRGVFCFQAMMTRRGPVVFEINARFGGGYPLAHYAGGNFARWLLEETFGLERTAANDWRSGTVALRYDVEAFR